MSEVTRARVGFLFDYLSDDRSFDENILPTFELVADDFMAQGLLEQ